MNGIVIVDKPAGITSHDVVHQIRRIFGTKRVGHTGTLDPEATGVLVVCIGNATRLAEYLSVSRKTYIAEVTFGIETDTQDIWGAVTSQTPAQGLSITTVESALDSFRGTINQVPPMVSAIKQDGKRLYALARQGITAERPARPIEIYRLELLSFTCGECPKAALEIECSSGTYIRTIAADIGSAVGTGAAMSALQRTLVGDASFGFHVGEAYSLDALDLASRSGAEQLAACLRPLAAAVSRWPAIVVSDADEARIRSGQALLQCEFSTARDLASDSLVAILDAHHTLVAVATVSPAGTVQPVKVLAQEG